jgi:cyclopropane fatty-acyl-phospholipid synthase-like methyltransferase
MQNVDLEKTLPLHQFPLSANYDVAWLYENEMGPCSVWLAEYLIQSMELTPAMRVLDLGCGKAMSSIFLAKEFGVNVWAADLWISASENWARIVDAHAADHVFPVSAEAHALPFARGFFDAIVSLDAYHYFGTDELYLPYVTKFVKPGGQIGIVIPGVVTEWTETDRRRLDEYWEPYLYTHHSPAWWAALWQRSEAVEVQVADTMPQGHDVWLHWDKTLEGAGVLQRDGDVGLLEADGGNLTFTRVVARRLPPPEGK